MGVPRYLLLCASLFALLFAHSWSDAWIGDFWIYTATLREVAQSPLRPRHPLLGNDDPFVFVSPYTWVLGLASRLSRLTAFQTLVAQGLVNLALLLAALWGFVRTWLRRPAAAFYALLFVLFLWGRDPWQFSGFFHLRSLAVVLPYPSTFAFGLALLTLAAFPGAVASGRLAWCASTLPVLALLWILHPVNGLFLALGLVVSSVTIAGGRRRWELLALVFAASLALAFAWPFFSVTDLWFGQLDRVHEGNDTMYDAPLPRIAPALLGAPWLLVRLRQNPRDPLTLLTLALGALVFLGGLTGQFTLGRLVSHTAILLQISCADACAALEERLRGVRWRRAVAPAAAAILVAVSWPGRVKPTIDESWRGDTAWLSFLETRVGPYAVVMTDLETCWYVPTFAGKVVAYPMQLPFVPDHEERVRRVERFFAPGVGRGERCETLRRFGAKYLLLDESRVGPLIEELRPLGESVYSGRGYELLRVAPCY
ncbi:MAG TPA: hypothetical protein VFM88_09425 [Vicinamibacteria bacterium]|nr:hypothetical protein [Vicinamibacteria bacterium]